MYTKVEKVIKILRFLPNKYEAKMMIVQEAKDVTKIPLEALIGSCMIHKINMNNHQQVEEKKHDTKFKASIIDNEQVESEGEDFDIITKKFMKQRRSRG